MAITLGILAAPFLLAAVAVLRLFERPLERSRGDVVDVMERYLEGRLTDDEWDDFLCIPIADPILDGLRKEWIEASYHTEQEREFVHEALEKLRQV